MTKYLYNNSILNLDNVGRTPATTMEEIEKNGIAPKNCWDAHVWIEIENADKTIEKIIDYNEKKLKKSIGIGKKNKLLYRPFDINLQKQLHKKSYTNYKNVVKKTAMDYLDEEEYEEWKNTMINETGHCFHRVYLLFEDMIRDKKYENKKIKIRYGSLGYIKNGSPFWEFG